MLYAQRMLFLAVMLISFFSPAFASLEDELINFTYPIDAKINIENPKLETSPQTMLVRIDAYNPSDSKMPLYLMKQTPEGWSDLRLLGALPAREYGEMDLEIIVEYEMETFKRTRYVIVGRSEEGGRYGRFFEITEDWAAYEQKISETITLALLVSVPVIGTMFAMIIAYIAKIAHGKKGEKQGEAGQLDNNAEQSMPAPKIKGTPFWERLANVLVNPWIIALELFWIAVFVVLIAESVSQKSGVEDGLQIVALSGLCAFVVPFIYFFAAWYLSKREEGKPLRFFAGMFSWGMFVAFFSLLVSSTLAGEFKDIGILPYALIVTLVVSPIVEESLKGFGVRIMAGHREYNDILTGMLLGFTCGAGFAFVENWFYFSSKANPFDIGIASWATLILYRSFFNTMAHGCFTASIGALIGYVKNVPKLRDFTSITFLPGLAIAIGIHMVFNLSAVVDGFMVDNRQIIVFVFNPMLIILLAAMFFIVLMLAILDEKKRKIRREGLAKSGNPPQGGSEKKGA